MTNIEYLESIIEEAQEALGHASAGGNREYAFDLMVSVSDLHDSFNRLNKLNLVIADELAEGNR